MQEFRQVDNVIKYILTLIPIDNIKLINELNEYYNDELWNKTPELLKNKECWNPFLNILNNNIIEINEKWQIKIYEYLQNL